MILISEIELATLKENKGNELTMEDGIAIIENKQAFTKFVKKEIAEYQYQLWNWWFTDRRKTAEDSIFALNNLLKRLENIEKALDAYNEQEALKKIEKAKKQTNNQTNNLTDNWQGQN